jgi:hypothetical protein
MKKESVLKCDTSSAVKGLMAVHEAAEKFADILYNRQIDEYLCMTMIKNSDGSIERCGQEMKHPAYCMRDQRDIIAQAMYELPGATDMDVRIGREDCGLSGGGTIEYEYKLQMSDLDSNASISLNVATLVIPPSATEEEKKEMQDKMTWFMS